MAVEEINEDEFFEGDDEDEYTLDDQRSYELLAIDKIVNYVDDRSTETGGSHPERDMDIARLAASMKKYGLLSPIIVRDLGEDRYERIAGARRLMAAKALGWTEIDAFVIPMNSSTDKDVKRYEMMMEDNLLHKKPDIISLTRARLVILSMMVKNGLGESFELEDVRNPEFAADGVKYFKKAYSLMTNNKRSENFIEEEAVILTYTREFLDRFNVGARTFWGHVQAISFLGPVRWAVSNEFISLKEAAKVNGMLMNNADHIDTFGSWLRPIRDDLEGGVIDKEAAKAAVLEKIALIKEAIGFGTNDAELARTLSLVEKRADNVKKLYKKAIRHKLIDAKNVDIIDQSIRDTEEILLRALEALEKGGRKQ